jgi:hypothetical protein
LFLPKPDVADNKDEHANETFQPDLFVSVYGGKKDDVTRSFMGMSDEDNSNVYGTWVNIAVLKRFGTLFGGSVESAGGATDLLFLIIVSAVILGFYVFWQIVVFFLVIILLALFSGGAALKFVHGTFIEALGEKVDSKKLDGFLKEQIASGRFVEVRVSDSYSTESFTRKASSATGVFKLGIYIALIVATAFLAVEVLNLALTHLWLTNTLPLVVFGLAFLLGAVVMDAGVVLRWRLAKSLRTA